MTAPMMPLQPVTFSRRDLDLSLLWARVQQQGGMARVSPHLPEQ